ncbi:HepT-like ribonuclease domain-containing protein [Microcystis aeruginosa]|uniref:HepT-like ribonuclease domain-containing protein n=1 Tax=Microcystis aeruginosa TaxID=1126 RepID=UPI001E5E8E20|nr:HepT-like ribonuclease domain-containing protein [Microcystis aeruginosa]
MRVNYPNIPWKNIAGMRDKLVHEYWAIDEKVVWKVIQNNLPQLKRIIISIIEKLQ